MTLKGLYDLFWELMDKATNPWVPEDKLDMVFNHCVEEWYKSASKQFEKDQSNIDELALLLKSFSYTGVSQINLNESGDYYRLVSLLTKVDVTCSGKKETTDRPIVPMKSDTFATQQSSAFKKPTLYYPKYRVVGGQQYVIEFLPSALNVTGQYLKKMPVLAYSKNALQDLDIYVPTSVQHHWAELMTRKYLHIIENQGRYQSQVQVEVPVST